MDEIERRIEAFIKKRGITFDANSNAVISKSKLASIILQAKLGESFHELSGFPIDSYLLIDHLSAEVYFIPVKELAQWESDGSFEAGDHLYKIEPIKKYQC